MLIWKAHLFKFIGGVTYLRCVKSSIYGNFQWRRGNLFPNFLLKNTKQLNWKRLFLLKLLVKKILIHSIVLKATFFGGGVGQWKLITMSKGEVILWRRLHTLAGYMRVLKISKAQFISQSNSPKPDQTSESREEVASWSGWEFFSAPL